MNFFKTVLGASDHHHHTDSDAETIEILINRLENSSLLDDRRDSCRALRSLSKKYRIETGKALTALTQILEMDKADNEIVTYALDTICNIVSPEQFEEEEDNPHVTANIGEQFTEMFIKNHDHIMLVLNCLEDYDFKVRWSAIKLLTNLLANRHKEIQEVVLLSPMGISRLMDLLVDSREIIRNDALLLLIQLTKGNANIQKIVAFENAFDRLFDVIREEGCSDGGIVVEDCLILMLNLLKNNPSNQQFFKEGSYIQRLAPMFLLAPEVEELGMTPQKVSNLHCMLQIVRLLLSPNNSQQMISSCQKIMRSCGLLETLCNMLMGSGIPPDILTETINTVAEIIRGDTNNQDYFNNVQAPSFNKSIIVVLLMSMVNEKQPLTLRCSVLYCFQCYLYRNEKGQNSLIQTLLPSTKEVSTLTTGQLLCGGLFSIDPLSNWFSAVSLMYALIDNPTQKENILRSLLATSTGGQAIPVSLLQQCVSLLQQAQYKLQSRVGLLMLLCMWMSHCATSVKAFLSISGTISYLMAQITTNEHDENEYLVQGLCAFLMGICIHFNDNSVENYTNHDLVQLLVKRIGIETYNKKLSEVSKHENYSKAAKQPQIKIKSAADLLLDYEFCKLVKSLESVIGKTIEKLTKGNNESITELSLSQEASTLVGQYKNIIREQDNKMIALQDQMKHLEAENIALKNQLLAAENANQNLTDQNILLKAQLSATSGMGQTAVTQNGIPSHHVERVDVAVQMTDHEATKLAFYEAENIRLVKDLESMRVEVAKTAEDSNAEIEKMKKDNDDLLELLADQDQKLRNYRKLLKSLGQPVESDDDDN